MMRIRQGVPRWDGIPLSRMTLVEAQQIVERAERDFMTTRQFNPSLQDWLIWAWDYIACRIEYEKALNYSPEIQDCEIL